MRKIIETVSTLSLWAVWIVGSGLAVYDFILDTEISKSNLQHLSLIAWSPMIAMGLFALMLVAVRFSKNETTKKTMPNEHSLHWSAEDLAKVQNAKLVDLSFLGTGLACHVKTRDVAAAVLHNENHTVHVKVSAKKVDEPSRAFMPQAL